MSKGTGKYYSPVYKVKRTPESIKKAKIIKRSFLACLAIAVTAVGVTVWQVKHYNSDSLIEVISSRQTLTDVETYPRIVNAENPVETSYEPQNLVSLNTIPNGEEIFLRRDAAENFLEMLSAMANDGLAVIPIKGYTSYEEQSQAQTENVDKLIAGGYSSEDAADMTSQTILAPGANEAQLGTSIDVSTEANSVDNFSSTEQYEWLCSNAYKYGFIIRYPEDKQNITGVEAKPWHLRFVGVSAAEYMKSENLCLEEYVALVISDNPSAVEESGS